MKIYEYMKCYKCKKSYKGEFYVNLDGKIYCKDCNNVTDFPNKLEIKKTNEKELLHKQLLAMMIYDISELYNYYSTREESALDKFLDEDNKLYMEKVFFMGNDLSIVDKAQEVAYISIKYSNISPSGDYIEDAKYFVERYISLREYKFSEEEMTLYKDKLNDYNLIYKLKDGIA